VPRRVGLHEQQRRAHVDRERGVDRGRLQVLEVLVAGHRVVGDEDVDVAERLDRRRHAGGGGRGIGEVALDVALRV
jgi:hypothetical protein